ncbi:MAG: TerB family tellurite resistance protein [Halioglobus sp.]|nr:TerB family tellurite resistance protein [Halioglobus sp.]
MALVDLKHVKRIFGGNRDTNNPGMEVYRELLLMVLSRATDVDAYTHPAEVEVVQRVLKDVLGEDIDGSDVRVAARSRLYETAPLEKYISRVGSRLSKTDRRAIVFALIEVLKADGRVASSEASYFNRVAAALKLDFADVAGLLND